MTDLTFAALFIGCFVYTVVSLFLKVDRALTRWDDEHRYPVLWQAHPHSPELQRDETLRP